ncbi:MAG TPA: WHG domain-containing protein [Paenibacillaceae bacterium]
MPRAGLDQQTVVQIAAELADGHGLENLTLAMLAQKLGIRTPSLYNHVNGLPELRRKLTLYGLNRLRDALARAAMGRSGDEALRAMAEAYLAFARKHPGLYEATQRSLDRRDAEVEQAAAEAIEPVLRVLEAYGLQGEAAIHTVRGFRSLLHGFADIERQGGFGMEVDPDASFHLLVEIFLAGIHSLSAGSEK